MYARFFNLQTRIGILARIPARMLAVSLVGVIFLIFPALASDHAARCAVDGNAFKALKPADEAKIPPALEFSKADGGKLTLQSLKGRGVIVNFWATWCVPCVREMPELNALRKELAPAGIDVLAVSMDRGGHKVIADFFTRYKIDNLEALHIANNDATRALGIRGLPTTLLIDPKGREVARIVGLHKYDTAESIAYFKRCIGPGGS